jgi:hypothetical protein
VFSSHDARKTTFDVVKTVANKLQTHSLVDDRAVSQTGLAVYADVQLHAQEPMLVLLVGCIAGSRFFSSLFV